MHRIYSALILFFILMPAYAEFDFDAYQTTSFADIKASHRDDLLKASQKSDYVISAATFKYRMTVTFTKKLRKLSANNKTVINAWQNALRVSDDFVNLYQYEFKAVFGKESYWIPVQEELLPHMGSELHAGDKFELYIIVIGAIKNRLVFLTTEFKSDRVPL